MTGGRETHVDVFLFVYLFPLEIQGSRDLDWVYYKEGSKGRVGENLGFVWKDAKRVVGVPM